MNGQNNIGLPGRFSVEKLKHKLYSGLCLQLHILMYRGERRRYHLAHGNVVKADNGNVFRYPDAAGVQTAHNANGELVGRGDKRGDIPVDGNRVSGSVAGCNAVHFIFKEDGRIEGNTAFRQRCLVSEKAFLQYAAVLHKGAGIGDARMAFFCEIPGGEIAALEILQSDVVYVGLTDVAVDQDNGNMECRKGIKKGIVENTGEKKTVHVPVLKKADELVGGLYRAQHQIVTVFPKCAFNNADGGGVERVLHHIGIVPRDDMVDEGDHFGGFGDQSPCGHIWCVAKNTDRVIYSFNRFLGDTIRPAMNDVGNSSAAYSGVSGDIFNGSHKGNFLSVFM